MKKLLGLLALLAALGGSARAQQQNFPSGAGTGGGITWLTVATLPGSPALNTTDGVTDGNGFSCTVGGGSTKVLCRWNGASWDVVNTGPATRAACAVTNSVLTGQNGADPACIVPGLPGDDVNSATYTVQADNGTTTIDRGKTKRFITTAPTVTMCDPTVAGCDKNFLVVLVASGVTVTVNRAGTAVFNIYGRPGDPTLAATTFNLTTGQYATLSSPDNANWLVRIEPAGAGSGSVASVTPVTANGAVSTDQQLIELSLPAGFLNSLKQPYWFHASGVFSTAVAQTPTFTYKAKLCTVSGCGSGTSVTLANIVTTAAVASITNNNWGLNIVGITAATGATGNLEAHGSLAVDLGATTATADSIFNDTNTAVSGNIDLTAALFVDFTVAESTASATVTITERDGAVMPQSNPAGSGGGGVSVQVNGSSTGITTTANFNNTTPAAPKGADAVNVTWPAPSGTSISGYVPNVVQTNATTRWGSASWTSLSGGVANTGPFQTNTLTCTTASSANASATAPPLRTCGTGATANTVQEASLNLSQDAFIGTTTNPTNMHVITFGKAMDATTAVRAWPLFLGDSTFYGTPLGTTDTPVGNGIAIRFSSVAGDTNFMAVMCNASVCTATSTGIAGDANLHRFEVRLNDATGTAVFLIDGTVTNTLTTNYPASVAVSHVGMILDNTTTTARTLSWNSVYASTIM